MYNHTTNSMFSSTVDTLCTFMRPTALKKVGSRILLATSLTLASMASHASVMQVELDKTDYQIGETITATIRMQNPSAEVALFDLSLDYSAALLQLVSADFGNALTVLDPTDQQRTLSAGAVRLQETNLDAFDYELAALQGSSFVLATLRFSAQHAGNFQLNLRDVLIGDWFGNAHGNVSLDGAIGRIQAAAVSAPALAWLALPMLLWLRRRSA